MGYVDPHGSVLTKPSSFLQAFLISFAPLYISTWLAVLFFNIIFYSDFWWGIRVIAVFLLISTVIGAAPSGADITVFFRSSQFDLIYTVYQIFLIVISILIFSLITSPNWVVKFLGRIILLPIIAGLSYELLKLSARFKDNWFSRIMIQPGLWFQKITTKEPNKKQLEVAIYSLKKVLNLEKT